MAEPQTQTPPAGRTGGGSIWLQHWGPLPVWAWGGLGIGAAVILRVWQQNKTAAAAAQQQTGSTPNTTPPMVNQDYITIINPVDTEPAEPPGQGRQGPPQGDQDHGKPPRPNPPPKRDKDRDVPGQPDRDNDRKPAPKPAGHFVVVEKWTPRNAPWASTISGIAAHSGIKDWGTVWNAPQNSALKARRKDPKLIQPGDRVWVPAA